RCYLLRQAHLKCLTVDHTVSQRLSDLGVLSPDKVRSHRWRNTLWNVIGGKTPGIVPQTFSLDLRHGDTLSLTTDGVTDPLPEASSPSVLHAAFHPPERAWDFRPRTRTQTPTGVIRMMKAETPTSTRRHVVVFADDDPQTLLALERALRHEPYELLLTTDPE